MPAPSLSTWYVYADGFGSDGKSPGDCQTAGHADSECSSVSTPPPGPTPFPYAGIICSAGLAAKVIFRVGDPTPDYDHIWGAGVGLDFTSNGVPTEFDAAAHGVIGLAFTIDDVPTGLRVEFPTSTRDPSRTGWDYWGATPSYASSPVKTGMNQVLWSDVRGPQMGTFDPSHLLGVQFHVSTNVGFAHPYSFCISDLKLLTN